MTPDNAALTRRFTDSADGVLWLTSSTLPGQVQELDELVRELRCRRDRGTGCARTDDAGKDQRRFRQVHTQRIPATEQVRLFHWVCQLRIVHARWVTAPDSPRPNRLAAQIDRFADTHRACAPGIA
nr:hypothetical protein [Paraburkholderia sp. UCT31]